jgi:hypothetical protein
MMFRRFFIKLTCSGLKRDFGRFKEVKVSASCSLWLRRDSTFGPGTVYRRHTLRYRGCPIRHLDRCHTLRATAQQPVGIQGVRNLFLPFKMALIVVLVYSTNSLIDRLIVFAINRCILTS